MNSPSRQPLSLLCIHSSTVVCPGAHTKEITFPALAEPVCQQNFTFSPYCYLRWWIVTTSSSPFPFHNPNTIALKYALIVCMHSCNPHSSKPSLVSIAFKKNPHFLQHDITRPFMICHLSMTQGLCAPHWALIKFLQFPQECLIVFAHVSFPFWKARSSYNFLTAFLFDYEK